MEFGQLSTMIGTLREMFDENPHGMTIDADLSRMLGAGLRDMHKASLSLEQYALEHFEQRLEAQQAGGTPRYRLVAPSIGNVVPFPAPLRPRPIECA